MNEGNKARLSVISKRLFDAGYRDIKLDRGDEWNSATQDERLSELLDVLEGFMDGDCTEITP